MPFVASPRQKSSQGIEFMKADSCLTWWLKSCHSIIQGSAIRRIRTETECLSIELVQRCFYIGWEMAFVYLFCLISSLMLYIVHSSFPLKIHFKRPLASFLPLPSGEKLP